MTPFNGQGSIVSRLQSHYKERVYFLRLSSQRSWYSFDRPSKDELTLEPPSGFESGTPRLGIQHPKH